LGCLLDDETLNPDVTFKFADSDETIRTHKCVLMIRSAVFRAMFSSEMIESTTKEVLIEDIDPSVMRELVRYLCTSEISERRQYPCTWENLLVAFMKYDIRAAVLECELKLLTHLQRDNLKSMLTFADSCNAWSLKRRCIKFAVEHNFMDVLDSLRCSENISESCSSSGGIGGQKRAGDTLENPEKKAR
jgi:speckle-type POZ protein